MAATKTRKRPTLTPEERAERLNAALTTLSNGVTELVTSERWTDYLAAQARFHNYSARNVLLILIQRPDATRVAGFNAWKALGRTVRKGEKGIQILAPMKVTIEDEATGDRKTIVKGFRIEHVFDVTQTDGDPLPEAPVSLLTDGDGDETLRTALVAQIEAAGFTVEHAPTGDASNGATYFDTRTVRIDSGLPTPQAVKTTAHELGHVLMHDPADPDAPKDRGLREVEAESVAYVVLHAHGYDAGDYSFGYVAGWSGGDAGKVQDVAARVQRTASRVLAAIEG